MIQKLIVQFSKVMKFQVPLELDDFRHMWDLVEKNNEPMFDYQSTDWRTLGKESGQYLRVCNNNSQ